MGRERGEPDPREIAARLQQRPKFDLGETVMSVNAHHTLNHDDVQKALARHHRGDWGDLEEEDRQANEEDLKAGNRLLSIYHDRNKVKFYILTEADRSYTTVMLPQDY